MAPDNVNFLRLSSSSPAIDKGNTTNGGLIYDQRGPNFFRIRGGRADAHVEQLGDVAHIVRHGRVVPVGAGVACQADRQQHVAHLRGLFMPVVGDVDQQFRQTPGQHQCMLQLAERHAQHMALHSRASQGWVRLLLVLPSVAEKNVQVKALIRNFKPSQIFYGDAMNDSV